MSQARTFSRAENKNLFLRNKKSATFEKSEQFLHIFKRQKLVLCLLYLNIFQGTLHTAKKNKKITYFVKTHSSRLNAR